MSNDNLLSRSAILNGYAEVTVDLGLDPYALLREMDLPTTCLSEPDLRIPTESALTLLEITAARAGILDLGLRISGVRRFSTLGAVGLFMREQPTIRKAMYAASENMWSHMEGVSCLIEESQGLAALMTVIAPQAGGPRRQAVELTSAVLVNILRRFLGQSWKPEMVAFSHASPKNVSRHIQVFGQSPIFDHDRNAIFAKAEDFDSPISGADPESAEELARYLRFVAGSRHSSFPERVQEVITLLLPRGECRIDQIADYFSVSRRTIHRRLAAENTTYEKLLQSTREDLVHTYLETGELSKTAISQLLGFSCLSAFSRWRKTHNV